MILYLRCRSPLWRNLFFIISLETYIILLNIFVFNVNDSSVTFARTVVALLSPTLWKDSDKLLQNKLLEKIWWYFITGDSGWNSFLYLKWEMLWHQVFNKCFFIFSFVDSIFVTVKLFWILIFVFIVNIFVISYFQFIYRIFFLIT